ncbi:MAG: hypothetical protein VB122_07970 [Erysipelotrichales bacterium]|nr:hypothetical protein [Erysipelotrichales bacterium]
MYEIKRSEREINGETVETWVAEMVSANMLEVEAGTTGYCGGDTGHGGRTYFRLKDLASTDMKANVVANQYGDAEEVTIEFGGDCELSIFIESLEFALKVLKEQSRE